MSVRQRARFATREISAGEMRSIGEMVVDFNQSRLSRGLTVEMLPAPALSTGKSGRGGYRAQKAKRGDTTIRDWWLSGRTRRAMAVLRVEPNQAVVGFSDPVAAQRAAINNARIKQFGVAAPERSQLAAALRQAHPIEVVVTRG